LPNCFWITLKQLHRSNFTAEKQHLLRHTERKCIYSFSECSCYNHITLWPWLL